MKTNLVVWACAASLASFQAISGQDWELRRNEDGIRLFTRREAATSLWEFRGEMTIQARLSSLVAVLDDAPSYPKWQVNCREARVLERKHFFSRHTYIVDKSALIVSDRDMIVHSTLSQEPGSKVIFVRMIGKPDYLPHVDGKVRVPRLEGFYQLIPNGGGQVRVIYQLLIDPGGTLPSGLAAVGIVNSPFQTLGQLRRIVSAEPYKSARYPQIQD